MTRMISKVFKYVLEKMVMMSKKLAQPPQTPNPNPQPTENKEEFVHHETGAKEATKVTKVCLQILERQRLQHANTHLQKYVPNSWLLDR